MEKENKNCLGDQNVWE